LSFGNPPPKQYGSEAESRRPRGRLGSFIIHGCYLSISEGPFSREATPTSHKKLKPAIDGATKVVTPIRMMCVWELIEREVGRGNLGAEPWLDSRLVRMLSFRPWSLELCHSLALDK
jgi:hypothetical protein